MAITLRQTATDTSGKTSELSYQEMNNNLKSFYYSSSLESNTLKFHFLSGSTSHSIDLSSYLDNTNIYSNDGSLTGARTVTADSNNLTFDMSTANFQITTDSAQRVIIQGLGTGNNPQVLGIDPATGAIKAMNTSSIAGVSTDTNIANTSLSLNGNRTLDLNSNDLSFDALQGETFTLTADNSATVLFQMDSGDFKIAGLPNTETPLVLGYNSSTGVLSYYSTASFGGGSTSPGGSDGQVQYNNGGAFGGESTFTYDDGNNTLTIQGATNQPSIVLSNAQSVAISNGSQLSEIQTFYSTNEVGTVAFVAEGAFNPSDTPTRLEFRTTNDGAGSPTTKLQIKNDGKLIVDEYGSGTFTGTATKYLAVDSSGNIIEEDVPSSGMDISRATPTTTHTFNTKITNSSNYLWNLEQGSGAPSGNGKMRVGMTLTTKAASTVTAIEFDRDSSTGNRDVTLDYLQEDGRIVFRNSSGTIIADGWDIKEVDTSNANYVRVYVDWTGGAVTLNNNTDYRVDFISDARIPLADASYNNITLQNESSTATQAVLVANDNSTFGDYTLVELKSNASNNGDVYVSYARLSEGSTTTFNDYLRRATFLNGVADTVTQLTVSDANDVALLEFRVVNFGNLSLALMGCDKIKGS